MSKLVLVLLAIFLPPIAVVIERGISVQFFLNILLTLCFGIPGMIHAIWIITRD